MYKDFVEMVKMRFEVCVGMDLLVRHELGG